MLVETYEQTEQTVNTDGVVEPECEAEALMIISTLKLDGQQSLLRRQRDEQTARCPYRQMSAVEKAVYEIVCPKKTELAKYRQGPIPLRILQVAAHAQGMFQELYVWSAESAIVPDPLLVGREKNVEENWRYDEYLLARWGDELAPFADLLKKSAAIMRARCIAASQRIAQQAEIFQKFVGGFLDEDIVRRTMPVAYYLD